MDNRYTPFGYHVEDGAISIAETEAAIIRQIFSDYIGGKSLKEIAAELTVRKVEYLPQKWQWNKNRGYPLSWKRRIRGHRGRKHIPHGTGHETRPQYTERV